MSNAYRLSGSGTILQTLLRGFFLTAAAIGGFFLLAFSAAFAVFIIAGVCVFGLIVFAWFWVRAKFFGKPFTHYSTFAKTRPSNDSAYKTSDKDTSGPVIEARKTPDGWSIDD